MRHLITTIVSLFLFAPLSVGATTVKLKPGQWETTIKTTMPGMPFSPPPQTGKSCLTRKQAEHPWTQLQANKQQHCKFSHVQRHSNSTTWQIECDGKSGHMTGKGVTKFIDDMHTQGAMQMVMHSDGEDMKMKIDMAGHWVSSNCHK